MVRLRNAGYSLRKLAKVAGCSEGTIRNYEILGRIPPAGQQFLDDGRVSMRRLVKAARKARRAASVLLQCQDVILHLSDGFVQELKPGKTGLRLTCLQNPLHLEQLDGGAGALKLLGDLCTSRAGAKVTTAALLLHIYTLQGSAQDAVLGGNVTLFFHELSDTGGPFVRAEFKHAQPQSHELRPLDEAAQVIEECKPQQMPEEPWDHLYASLKWVARWTQRVIPAAVWQQAMKEAKKTLVPKS